MVGARRRRDAERSLKRRARLFATVGERAHDREPHRVADRPHDRREIERRDYQEPGQRKRCEYHLTDKGKDLYPVLSALRQWGDKYLADPEGPSIVVKHKDCGARVRVKLMCDEGHEVPVDELERRPGPGLRLREVS